MELMPFGRMKDHSSVTPLKERGNCFSSSTNKYITFPHWVRMSISVLLGKLFCHTIQKGEWCTPRHIELRGPIAGKGKPIWLLYLPIPYANLFLPYLLQVWLFARFIGRKILWCLHCPHRFSDLDLARFEVYTTNILNMKNHSSSSSSSSGIFNLSEGMYSFRVRGLAVSDLAGPQGVPLPFLSHRFSFAWDIRMVHGLASLALTRSSLDFRSL